MVAQVLFFFLAMLEPAAEAVVAEVKATPGACLRLMRAVAVLVLHRQQFTALLHLLVQDMACRPCQMLERKSIPLPSSLESILFFLPPCCLSDSGELFWFVVLPNTKEQNVSALRSLCVVCRGGVGWASVIGQCDGVIQTWHALGPLAIGPCRSLQDTATAIPFNYYHYCYYYCYCYCCYCLLYSSPLFLWLVMPPLARVLSEIVHMCCLPNWCGLFQGKTELDGDGLAGGSAHLQVCPHHTPHHQSNHGQI
eukprot:g55301.t1